MHHHFVDWPNRAVSRKARLLRRQGKGPTRPYVNIEGYPRHVALLLIKDALKCWLEENRGFCALIGGLGARAPITQTTKYYVRCFDDIPFRSSDRSCVVDAACNAAYLLLGEVKASSMSDGSMQAARRASQRTRSSGRSESENWGFHYRGPPRISFPGVERRFTHEKGEKHPSSQSSRDSKFPIRLVIWQENPGACLSCSFVWSWWGWPLSGTRFQEGA